MQVTPYLFFNGRTLEAIEFYKKSLGAEVGMISKFSDCPEPGAAGDAPPDAVMHASFKVGETTIMASDGRCNGQQNYAGFSLAISPGTDEKAQRVFTDLSEGGQVTMPLQKTFFSSSFGMLTDKFGVEWMVNVDSQK